MPMAGARRSRSRAIRWTWRAQRGAELVAENIATTVHDIREARWVNLVWSRGGFALAGLGAILAASEGLFGVRSRS